MKTGGDGGGGGQKNGGGLRGGAVRGVNPPKAGGTTASNKTRSKSSVKLKEMSRSKQGRNLYSIYI